MTTATLRYGDFARPEERRRIDVNPDFHAFVTAAFHQWLTVADSVYWTEQGMDSLYEEAVRLLAASTFISQVSSGLEAIVSEITAQHDSAGIFASAMHNLSSQTRLEGNFKTSVMGYRIAPGKELVLLKDSFVVAAGDFGRGKILNYALLPFEQSLGCKAIEGVYANFARNFSMGRMAEGGLFVNSGRTFGMGNEAFQGVFVNLGTAESMGYVAKGGLYVNNGDVELPICRESYDTLSLTLGRQINLRAHDGGSIVKVAMSIEILQDSLQPLIKAYSHEMGDFRELPMAYDAKRHGQIMKTVKDIDNACRLIGDEKTLKAIEDYNWQGAQATFRAQLGEAENLLKVIGGSSPK